MTEGTCVGTLSGTLHHHAVTVLASRRTWWVMLTIHLMSVLVILAPVLLASITGDDTYWMTEKRAEISSYWQAWWGPLPHAFDLSGDQSRGAVLGVAERQVLALLTIDSAHLLSVPPYLVWAAVKTVLVSLIVLSVPVFLHQVRFRDRDGAIRPLQRSTTVFITLAMPLTFALGVKAQNISSLNGYNFYPSLTYGPFAGCVLVAALVVALSRRLEVRYRRAAAPTVALMMALGLVLNLSYELLALAVPLATLTLLLQPFPHVGTRWLQWRARLTVLAPLGITYTVIFAWIRWRVATMPCHATGTCYPGTTVDVRPRALLYSFLGSLPGNNADVVADQAHAAGRAFPGMSVLSVAVAVVATLSLGVLWMSWTSRNRGNSEAGRASRRPDGGSDSKGLLVVLAGALLIAVGSAGIMGITETAAQAVTSPALPLRNGVMTWSALSLAALVVVRLLTNARWRFAGPAAIVALAAVMVTAVSIYLPRNVFSAQENRVTPFTVLVDTLHREVAMGDTSDVGDARRCAAIADAFRGTTIPSGRASRTGVTRTLNGAYAAFEYYYGTTYCSQDLGHTTFAPEQ